MLHRLWFKSGLNNRVIFFVLQLNSRLEELETQTTDRISELETQFMQATKEAELLKVRTNNVHYQRGKECNRDLD